MLKAQAYGTSSFPAQYEVIESCTLQCTDMTGGNNKFYVIELHKSGDRFRIYSCYGRTGTPGKKEERIPHGSEYYARREYEAIKREKLRKYTEVKLAATSKGSEVGNSRILSDDIKKDKLVSPTLTNTPRLDPEIEMLVNRLYQEAGNGCKTQLDGSLKTSVENPLGTLTLSQIREGKDILQQVNNLLVEKPSLINTIETEVVTLTNEFYSAIPQAIPLRPRGEEARQEWLKKYSLNNQTILDDKFDLLDLLSDVEGMIKGFGTNDVATRYSEIGAHFEYCPRASKEFQIVKEFVENTQSRHHSWRLGVKNVWAVEIKAQKSANHQTHMESVGNIKALFHGSGPANILGICKKGLLLRPPGVYITGSMFGNGLYFADQSTKSSQYSFGRFGGNRGTGGSYFMFVTDVALGKIKEYYNAQSHLREAPSGYNSVMGKAGGGLIHNEFIVYNTKQQEIKYLVEFTM
jgi:poly [ADP-ribose] polymerase